MNGAMARPRTDTPTTQARARRARSLMAVWLACLMVLGFAAAAAAMPAGGAPPQRPDAVWLK